MLGLVDGIPGIGGRRPPCPRRNRLLRAPGQLGERRQRPFRSAQHFEPVKRRDSRPSLREIDPRPGKDELALRRARCQPQCKTLRGDAIGGGLELRQVAPLRVSQERVFHHLLRKHLLRQTRHEHRVEAEAARRCHRRDEDLAVPLAGGWDRQLGQPARKNQPHFGEGDRPDRTHGSKLGEQRQHPGGVSKCAGGESAERVQPGGPRGARGERGESVEQRQREVAQGCEIGQLALDPLRLGLVLDEGAERGAELRLEPLQPPLPAIAAADDSRVEEELLPTPGGSQAPRHDRRVEVCRPHVLGGREILCLGRGQLGVRRHPPVARWRRFRRRAGDRLGDLAEAEVLGEPARGEAVGGAGKEREKGAAGGIGLLRSGGEVRGNAGAHERLFEQRAVLGRRPEQHRHAVERDSSLRLAAHQPGNLDALAALSRRGEEHHVVAGRRDGRRPFHEKPLLHPRQGRVGGLLKRPWRDVESSRDPRCVRRGRDGQQRSAEPRDEALFQGGAQRKIDQQRGQVQQRRFRFQREPEDRRAVGQGGSSELRLVGVEDPPEISAGPRSREAQLLDGPRERPGQAGLPSDRIELPQPAAKLMDDPRTDSLHPERRKRRWSLRP